MLVQQYISEFNKQASNIKFLSFSDEISLSNKLKLIQTELLDGVVFDDVQDFFSNLYLLLCQSSSMKSELLENCVDILLTSVNSQNSKVKNTVLSDFRFLSALIGNTFSARVDNDEERLIKILKVIREFLGHGSELDEHNLKLIVEVLRDHTENHQSSEVSKLCLHVLANLCLENNAARYLITRTLKTTALKDKIAKLSNDLVSFKFFLLLEDESQPSDLKYFLVLSLQDVRTSVKDLSLDSIKHSLDIMRHIDRLGLHLESKLTDEEKVMTRLTELMKDLIEKLQSDDSDEKKRFFDGIFQFLRMLLGLESELVHEFEDFAEAAFVSAGISRSANALMFLTAYVKAGGSLKASEIVVDSLLDHFIGDHKDGHLDYEQQFAFLNLLDPLQASEKLSEVHINLIEDYFNDIIACFKRANISSLDDEEIFRFIYFLFSLSSIAKTRVKFFSMLNAVLKLDFVPVLILKGHLTRREEILTILFQLASVENFPNKKVISMLARSGTRAEASISQNLYKSFKRSDIESSNSRFIGEALAEELQCVIQRVNSKMDSNENPNFADAAQLYRHKINYLCDHVSSLTSSLERSTSEVTEVKQKIAMFRKTAEKQEFTNWCLHLDNERTIAEATSLTNSNRNLQDSISKFTTKLDKFESAQLKTELILKNKEKEISQLITSKTQMEQKLLEAKEKLNLAQQENESRITELKESLENEKKSKGQELAEAITEQKRLSQKLAISEKEILKFQELIKQQEKEIVQKQEKIQTYEVELKESEQMKSTIMSLMQGRSFRK